MTNKAVRIRKADIVSGLVFARHGWGKPREYRVLQVHPRKKEVDIENLRTGRIIKGIPFKLLL